ncbi:CoA-binding protein [Actinoallomurus sp. NBC_01490]|jgi:predicted CoA-binding protein|uniref:CoA-binding protein n=1 Tax=Actinoallomurus sp. NBC_01490 TaxID=2903557 RepID=UPI002E32C264|nr:CoA-binding protein [Actinoallomurus sp. NBC_01490]
MSDRYADEVVIRRILLESRTWAFVGLRDNPGRTAYDMAQLLQSRGKTIVPVHPDAATVLGEPGVASLAELPSPVNVVGVYRRAEHAGQVTDEAIELFRSYGPRTDGEIRAIWYPLDVVDEAAAARAADAGLDVVMNRCPAIEWARLRLPR